VPVPPHSNNYLEKTWFLDNCTPTTPHYMQPVKQVGIFLYAYGNQITSVQAEIMGTCMMMSTAQNRNQKVRTVKLPCIE